jgi:glycosyltransferase involved in cell wall biosynthesis
MVVAHIIGELPVGGAERLFVDLFNAIDCGEKFVVLLRDPPGGPSMTVHLDSSAAVHVVPVRKRFLPFDLLRLANFLRKKRCDVVHSHMFWANLYGSIAAFLARVPAVVTSEHGRNEWKGAFHRWAETALISRIADRRLCVSEDILRCRRDVDGVPERLLEVVPNGTLIPEETAAGRREDVVIGSVGRLVPAKDFPTLVEAAALLLSRGYRFRTEIVGEGPEHDKIQRAIDAAGVAGHVALVGQQNNVGEWLDRWSIFVSSSIREGQPVALLEAMAHGLPCVATSVGGVPDTLRDGSEGLLVQPGRPDLLADAVASLLDDRAEMVRLGAAARQRVIDNFSIDALAQRCVDIYRQILRNNAGGHRA